ncbi:MAG: transposase [Lewinellaceae bacterium]|nr:transposase [Lewinellaceae bacterium]
MTAEQLKTLKDNLWAAAIKLRADSDLKLNEFSTPVLGLIFLKFADNKYKQVEAEIQAELEAQQNSRRQRAEHEIAIEQCGFYLPKHARYEYLLNLPEEEDIDKALKTAMGAIEQYKPELKDTLPQDEYFRLTRNDKQLPKTLLKLFQDIPEDASGDVFGQIYEFFLGKFAMYEGQGGGEFFTPTSVVKYMVEVIEPYRGQVVARLQQEEVAGFDETTMHAEGQAYAHVASGSSHTFFFLGKRDYATMDEMGILPEFKGIAVHDRYANYFGYDCQHSLCNAHLLRNLQAVIDQHNDYWAGQLQQLLRNINKAVKRAKTQGKEAFSASHCTQYRQRYMNWVRQGLELHPAVPKEHGGNSPPKQNQTHNLLIALRDHVDEVLRFMYDFRVPFDNNRAERDIRMLKVKMKISGFFHRIETGNRFLRIRAYLSTAAKQGYSAFEALKQLFTGQAEPFVSKLVWGMCQTG